jgi:hypothetical protein
VLADLHCGHLAGLTPPRWQIKPKQGETPTKRQKAYHVQQESWAWYVRAVSANGPYDHIVINGDAIDGRGERSGSTELIAVDRAEQCEMALQCVQRAMGKKRVNCTLTYGTAYHAGSEEDWEERLASDLNAKIGAHERLECEGFVLDFKHHCGGSSVPYGRATAISKEAVWDMLWAELEKIDKADLVVRSHVHWWQVIEDDFGIRMTTPALQAANTKFGARRCSGTVSFGFVVLDVDRHAGIGVRRPPCRIKSTIRTTKKI